MYTRYQYRACFSLLSKSPSLMASKVGNVPLPNAAGFLVVVGSTFFRKQLRESIYVDPLTAAAWVLGSPATR